MALIAQAKAHSEIAVNFDIEYLSGHVRCFRRASQVPTSYIVGRYHAVLTMHVGCFSCCRLRMPWGAKKIITESKLPEVSANLCCAISLKHSCIQKLESNTAILPATTLAENFVKPDKVSTNIYVLRNLVDTQLHPETGK